jgi:CyaY protein
MREMLARDIMTTIESGEAEFNQAATATLAHIEQALEDADLDFETPADGIIEAGSTTKDFINRHGCAGNLTYARAVSLRAAGRGWIDTRAASQFMTNCRAGCRARRHRPLLTRF